MADYLASSEYAAFGIPGAASDQVAQASIVIDAFLQRPHGLIYEVDAQGAPCYMSRKTSEVSVKLTAGISPGTLVTLPITSAVIVPQGSGVVLDKGQTTMEVCKVASVSSAGVVLASVQNSHAQGASVDYGLCVEETLPVAKNRYYVTASIQPLRRVISAQGRISYGRRSDSSSVMQYGDTGILSALQQFGGAPTWQDVNLMPGDIELGKGEIWTPMGILMSPFTEVHVSYLSGWTQDLLPIPIKQACALLCKAIADSPAQSNIKVFRAGEVQMERFLDTIMDQQIKSLLSPYRARFYV